MSWPKVALGEVCDFNPKTPRELGDDLPVSFLPMASMGEDGRVAKLETRSLGEVRKGYTFFRRDDVLAAKITPCYENNKIGIAHISTECGFASTEFHVISPDETKLDRRYLTYFIRRDGLRRLGEKRMTGSAGQKLSLIHI